MNHGSMGSFRIDLFVKLIFLYQIYSVVSGVSANCYEKYTCTDCIQTPGCAWCSKPKSGDAQCLPQMEISRLCEDGKPENPKSSINVIKNDTVRDDPEGFSTIQLQPQHLQVTLRIGEPAQIEFKFKKASDYPVDIYYLMDFSKSMEATKYTLVNHSIQFAEEMKKKAPKLQLGFGGFIDKVTLPYTNTHPDKLTKPCSGCQPTYSFKNHMPLSNDTKRFPEELKKIGTSGNEDIPEGGLDGLLQAIVCKNEINWRENSWRIIVFCTNEIFHIAGDGKLGGIVEPHDGNCHLDTSGMYTHSLIYDYPSISLISQKAKENSMNIIFAIGGNNEKKKDAYKIFETNNIGVSVIGVVEGKSGVTELVAKHFEKLSVAIYMTHNATASTEVKFQVKCPESDWADLQSCTKLKVGAEVHFRATIEVFDCSHPEQILEIKPAGMVDTLIVHLKVICQCACENPNHPNFMVQSPDCESRGNLTCGRCSCPDTHYGTKCQCERKKSETSNAVEDAGKCVTNNVTCSNRGTCSCGICRCDKPDIPGRKVYGHFCECDNFSCPSDCSGHGTCSCGKCKCKEGWSGPDCNCETDTSACVSPSDSTICSNRGDCECGKCQCQTGVTGRNDASYSGEFCERCLDCKVNCTNHMDYCVDCLVHKSGPYVDSKCAKPTCYNWFKNISLAGDVREKMNLGESSTLCSPIEFDENGCFFKYVPYYVGDELWVVVDEKKTCPEPINVVAISAGVVGSTVAAGIIALLVWKLVTSVHDKREFDKFELQRANTKWGQDDNPLFRRALTTHINPAFEGYDGVEGK